MTPRTTWGLIQINRLNTCSMCLFSLLSVCFSVSFVYILKHILQVAQNITRVVSNFFPRTANSHNRTRHCRSHRAVCAAVKLLSRFFVLPLTPLNSLLTLLLQWCEQKNMSNFYVVHQYLPHPPPFLPSASLREIAFSRMWEKKKKGFLKVLWVKKKDVTSLKKRP